MASPRASRWPPPLVLLLLPLLLPLLPAVPGTRGQPSSPDRSAPSGAPLAGSGLVPPPEPGSELKLQPHGERRGPAYPGPSQTSSGQGVATRRGPSGRLPQGGSVGPVRNHWPESNTEPHIENITFYQDQVSLSAIASKEGVMIQTPRKSHASSSVPEDFTPLLGTTDAGGRNDSLSGTNFTISPSGYSPEIATALTSQSNTSVLVGLHLATSSSESEERIAPSQTESGTSWGSLPEEVTWNPQVAVTTFSSQSSFPAVALGGQTVLSKERDSTEPGLSSLPFSRTPGYTPTSDHPSPSGSMKELNNSPALSSSPLVSHTKSGHVATTVTDGGPRMPQSLTVTLGPRNETDGFPRYSGTATTSASVHSSPAIEELKRNSRTIGNPGVGGFIEPSTENGFGLASSETSVGFWQNDSPTFAGHQLAGSSDAENGSSASQTEAVSGSVPSTRGGGSTAHWSLTNSKTFADMTGSSTSYPEVVNSSVLTQFPDSAQESEGSNTALGARSYSEPSTKSLSTSSSESLDSSASRDERSITGFSYGQVSGADIEQRTSSDHTDHTYAASALTKGERTLLSITENSSSSDKRESSTSYVQISNSSHLGSSSSQAQTEKSNVSSHNGEYAQPSTESLVTRTSHLPSYTSAVNVPSTLVLLDSEAGSVGDSSLSSSGPPLPVPSTSRSHPLFSPPSPAPGASAHPVTSAPSASLSSSPPPLPASSTAALPAPPSITQTTLPHASSTPVLPGASETPGASVRTSTTAAAPAVLHRSPTADPKNQSSSYQERTGPESKPRTPVPLQTESTGAGATSSPSRAHLPPGLTESPTEKTRPATSTHIAQWSPALTATTRETSHPPMTTPSLPSSTAAPTGATTTVQATAGGQVLLTSPEVLVPQVSTEGAVTTRRGRVHVDITTTLSPLTSVKETSTRLGGTEEYRPASHFPRASPPPATAVSTREALIPKSTTFAAQSRAQSPTALSSPASVNSCANKPCLHDGKCIVDSTGHGYRCLCPPSWQGEDCSVDVNECLSSPCPPLATCSNTQGSFICRCPVGYQLEKGICSLVRTFVTELKLKKTFLNTTVETHSDLPEVENEITKTLNVCFSTSPGYTRSTVHASRESSTVVISLQTTFSLASNVTLFDLADRMQRCVNSCRSSAEVCQLLGSQRRLFRAGSLCKRKSPECDKETSICTDLDGIALCQCKSGYFQFNKMDHSCRACEDGYRLENETCMSCPFGLGGLNCGNPYQLITVVIAAAGGGLLLILGIALIVTCCRKNKNDISKLIFKSGDFQMSPYAEYPKNPRSQEWGREAIEMHENGSTKNLLQMTDVYYSPTTIRNPELERNGLYPAYTGLPGSRHSCIFPGQYNPSFISDESRRRDYF
ncbi:protein HEG homolog 1 isoform X2 [Dasypus novemcinctus]|uniref:protein HEG homolog 1 isoform X2 n=1 Tax=Dasypus novemcinctus TaxID=9361 RepID=UPI00265E98A4|nr:protein HEG homolog 1 isoform X2 [Dasypus novemcinctus]